jgi:hypothetical protein
MDKPKRSAVAFFGRLSRKSANFDNVSRLTVGRTPMLYLREFTEVFS